MIGVLTQNTFHTIIVVHHSVTVVVKNRATVVASLSALLSLDGYVSGQAGVLIYVRVVRVYGSGEIECAVKRLDLLQRDLHSTLAE